MCIGLVIAAGTGAYTTQYDEARYAFYLYALIGFAVTT